MTDARRLYDVGNRDIAEQGQAYRDHVLHMRREGLYAKCDVAAELAHRDLRIAELESALAAEKARGQWIAVSERLPTEAEYNAGVVLSIRWPEGISDISSWQRGAMVSGGDYALMVEHFRVFDGRSSGVGYWCAVNNLNIPTPPERP